MFSVSLWSAAPFLCRLLWQLKLTLWPSFTNFSILCYLGRAPKCHCFLKHYAKLLPRHIINREIVSVHFAGGSRDVHAYHSASSLDEDETHKRISVVITGRTLINFVDKHSQHYFILFLHQCCEILKWNLLLYDLTGNSRGPRSSHSSFNFLNIRDHRVYSNHFLLEYLANRKKNPKIKF